MRILVVGCGSIGRRHIRLLREMGVSVAAHDTAWQSPAQARAICADLGAAYEEELWPVAAEGLIDGAIISTPPCSHIVAAQDVLNDGRLPLLIEKPLATHLDEAQQLLEYADSRSLPLLTGYSLRFHPGLRRLKQLLDDGAIGKPLHASIHCGSYLPDWRPGTDYRRGYAAKRETGGGVLLDCSHEIDLANWLFGAPTAVSCMTQHSGALEIDTEDAANLIVRYESGVHVNIHLDYLDRQYHRGCRIVGDAGTLEYAFPMDKPTPDDGEPHPIDNDDMYRAELANFLAVIRGEQQPVCTGEDGLRALKVALAAHESAESGRVVYL